MSDDVTVPGVDKPAEAIAESAKFGRELVTLTKAGGEWASAVLGNLPHDIVGLLADTVRAYRIERAVQLRANVIGRLRAKGHENAEHLTASPTILFPILEAAVDEDRDILQEMWEKLLASASAPETRNNVRKSFIDIIAKLDPADALVLQLAYEWTPLYAYEDLLCTRLKISKDEIAVSLANLINSNLLNLAGYHHKNTETQSSGYILTSVARLLLKSLEY